MEFFLNLWYISIWRMGLLNKIKNKSLFYLSLPATIYFNFKYFPFKQAVKLPVYLCLPRITGTGKYIINGEVKTGMIRLGFPSVSIFKGIGITLENKGTIIFNGECSIGADGAISVGDKGILSFGHKNRNAYGLKIVCYHKVFFGNKVRIGWNSLVLDTDFHSMRSEDGKRKSLGFGKIIIQDDVWIGSYCKILKNAMIPNKCTVATNTVVNKKLDCQPYSLIYPGGGIKIKYTGLYRDIEDDYIDYCLFNNLNS